MYEISQEIDRLSRINRQIDSLRAEAIEAISSLNNQLCKIGELGSVVDENGGESIYFKDGFGWPVRLNFISGDAGCIRLGFDGTDEEGVSYSSIKLSYDQVDSLVAHLLSWLRTRSFKIRKDNS